jgi:hypothetical protein
MSWRNQGITGSNNIPLGKSRRFQDDDGHAGEAESFDRDLKRGRDPEPRSEADGPRRRKKRNRWGEASENKAAGLMGLPTAILSSMTSEQLEAYTLHLRIEEISQKLRIDDVVPADGDRYVICCPYCLLRLTSTGLPRRHLNMTTTADVSTLVNIVTGSASRMNDTSLSRRL